MTDTDDKAQAGAPPKGKGRRKKKEAVQTPEDIVAEESEGTMKAETLRGDIRDRLLARIKKVKKPWDELTAMEQQWEIDAADAMARTVISRTIEIVHAEGAPSLAMNVKGVAFKKEMTATLAGDDRDENRHLLADQVGGRVLVTITSTARFNGEGAPATPEPDQRALALDEAAEKTDGASTKAATKKAAKKKAVKKTGKTSRKRTAKTTPTDEPPPAGGVTEPEIVTDADLGDGDDFDPETGEVLE